MPVTITERFFDPDDPDRAWDELSTPEETQKPSLWVEPDYASIPHDKDLPANEDERRLVWPGPALIMPAGLLPDGKPHSYDERDNAERICGVRPRTGAEADVVVWAYMGQQNALREAAGLARARRAHGKLEDTPETLAAIVEIHEQERARRAGCAG
jgi:hypothetical protein